MQLARAKLQARVLPYKARTVHCYVITAKLSSVQSQCSFSTDQVDLIWRISQSKKGIILKYECIFVVVDPPCELTNRHTARENPTASFEAENEEKAA